jgi:outer membrane protein assembly factor BamB
MFSWRVAVALAVGLTGAAGSTPAAAAAHAHSVPTAGYGYDTPVQATSPWPEMRHDRRNTGSSPIAAHYRGDRPWSFTTGKGVFSSPILGRDGTVYVGSADSWFYAIGTKGRLRWRFKTGNLIDSAATIGAYDARLRTAPLYVPSGDEHLYKLRSDSRRLTQARRMIWRFKARQPPGAGQLVDWWEGNAELAQDGTILAGNTGSAAYAINPDGTLKWQHQMGNSTWTAAARGNDGTSYWGSLDLFVHALDKDGRELWKTPTIGFVISSPALGADGTLYVGSFDSNLYALDSKTGLVKWKLATGEHVYSSPALDEDEGGRTRAIYIASADGTVYAVRPDGSLMWRYDTGDVVRSSPVLGQAPDGAGRIVYVGNGNGTLFALDARTGHRRWSFDTTSRDPVLRDRNDLNASPALGRTGIVIAGEDGHVTYVPYDYCLHRSDRRCSTDPGGVFAPALTRVFPLTAGGNTRQDPAARDMTPASILPTRLVVRHGGDTVDASIAPLPSANSLVQPSPPFDFSAHLSGDGHDLMVVPNGFLRPDTDYRLRLAGMYSSHGIPIGDVRLGATGVGTFSDTIGFRTSPSRGPLPLAVGRRRVSAFELRRLAVAIPAFLPSVNQIGFDGYDFLAAPVSISPPGPNGEGTLSLWVIAARRLADGTTVPDPSGAFLFPLTGRYRADSVILSASNITLTFSFGTVPLHLLQFRGQLGKSLAFEPGANVYAEANCAEVPYYGPFLPLFRLCNGDGQLISSGTFLTERYAARRDAANVRPSGVSVTSVALERPGIAADGSVTAAIRVRPGVRYSPKQHTLAILLTNADTGQPVGMDYKAGTAVAGDPRGNAGQVRLRIPRGTELPARVRAYVMTDVFPLCSQVF